MHNEMHQQLSVKWLPVFLLLLLPVFLRLQLVILKALVHLLGLLVARFLTRQFNVAGHQHGWGTYLSVKL